MVPSCGRAAMCRVIGVRWGDGSSKLQRAVRGRLCAALRRHPGGSEAWAAVPTPLSRTAVAGCDSSALPPLLCRWDDTRDAVLDSDILPLERGGWEGVGPGRSRAFLRTHGPCLVVEAQPTHSLTEAAEEPCLFL